MDFQKFYMGDVYDAYKYLGAHVEEDGVVFRTFAPQAEKVMIIGEFNNWQEEQMVEAVRAQFYEIRIAGAKPGQMYKYVIYGKNGRVEHCDPYGFGMELRPGFASIIRDLSEFEFTDSKWMKNRTRNFDKPLNIYELHLGSWKRKDADRQDDPDRKIEEGWYQYDEIAEDLIQYVKDNHYTHVEFMPLSEHPFDGSWGYQNTGFFAPTSRYGTAGQLQKLINELHRAGIGAIIDFVPAHFANDYYALKHYDGSELYEYPASDVSDSEWGTCNFLYSRREVACFMQSAANYWLTEYHFDGLRFDAVSRLIYWMGNEYRGVNDFNLNFLKKMNFGLHELHPTAMLIAEDSTSYPGCTKPVDQGGLGFDYKWDLGWMNDTLDYFMKQSGERVSVANRLTFSMFYFYNERHLLPLSHDEVVHGKCSLIGKMPGSYDEKFAGVRSFLGYMMAHPGKKLTFMGQEFGQFIEWKYDTGLDWLLLDYEKHRQLQAFVRALNRLYQKTPALWEIDYGWEGFAWCVSDDIDNSVIAFRRMDKQGGEIVCVCNFTTVERQKYTFGVEKEGVYEVLLNSDDAAFGGGGRGTKQRVTSKHAPMHGYQHSITVDLPGLSALYLRYKPKPEKKPAAKKKAEKKPAKKAAKSK